MSRTTFLGGRSKTFSLLFQPLTTMMVLFKIILLFPFLSCIQASSTVGPLFLEEYGDEEFQSDLHRPFELFNMSQTSWGRGPHVNGSQAQSWSQLHYQNHSEQSCIPQAEVGAAYTLSIWLPVVGRHEFFLKVVSSEAAHMRVSGLIKINDTIPFDVADCDGNCNFQLSKETIRTLRWPFFISVKRVIFNPKPDDNVVLVISAAVLNTRWLQLERV